MKFLVHLVGAWAASEVATGRYPKPVALAIGLLVSRLGPPTAMLALVGYAVDSMKQAGVFEGTKAPPARTRKLTRR